MSTEVSVVLMMVVSAVVGLVAGMLSGRRRPAPPPTVPSPAPPPPPKSTATEHKTAVELDEADIIDEVAAETDVSAGELRDLTDLADATRTRRRY